MQAIGRENADIGFDILKETSKSWGGHSHPSKGSFSLCYFCKSFGVGGLAGTRVKRLLLLSLLYKMPGERAQRSAQHRVIHISSHHRRTSLMQCASSTTKRATFTPLRVLTKRSLLNLSGDTYSSAMVPARICGVKQEQDRNQPVSNALAPAVGHKDTWRIDPEVRDTRREWSAATESNPDKENKENELVRHVPTVRTSSNAELW